MKPELQNESVMLPGNRKAGNEVIMSPSLPFLNSLRAGAEMSYKSRRQSLAREYYLGQVQMPSISNGIKLGYQNGAATGPIYMSPPKVEQNGSIMASWNTPLDERMMWNMGAFMGQGATGVPTAYSGMEAQGTDNIWENPLQVENPWNTPSTSWSQNDGFHSSDPLDLPYYHAADFYSDFVGSPGQNLSQEYSLWDTPVFFPPRVEASPPIPPREDNLANSPINWVGAQSPQLQLTSPTSAIILDPTWAQSKPTIFVVPHRAVNFTEISIQFSIQAFNLPRNYSVSSNMFGAVAVTPSGKFVSCCVRKDPTVGMDSTGHLEAFVGSFRTSNEVGLYTLHVRLNLPFRTYDRNLEYTDYHIVGDTVQVFVCRNYWKEGRKTPGLTFKLDLKSIEKIGGRENLQSAMAWGLACDRRTNRLYVTERVGGRVTCLDAEGRVLFKFKDNLRESRLNRPTGICCDEANRRVIVCDKDHHRICFFSMFGQYISSFGERGCQDGRFNYPWDVAVNSNGTRIAVTDSRNQRVQMFDSDGNFLCKFTPPEEEQPYTSDLRKLVMDCPRGVTFDRDGLVVYVTDFNTQNVVMMPADLSSGRKLVPDGKMLRPQGIVVDSTGTVLVADSRDNTISHLTSDGVLLCIIRAVGKSLLRHPINMALMDNDRIAVLDGDGEIHIF